MRIKLTGHYRGWKSNERVIPPGEYEVDDARLFGIADYLIKNGHAMVIDAPEPAVVVEPEPEPIVEIVAPVEPPAPAYPVKRKRGRPKKEAPPRGG